MIIIKQLNDTHPMELRTAPKAWGPAAQPPPKKVAPWAGLGVGFQNQEIWKKICPYSWNRRQFKNHGFLQHLSLKTLELLWLQDTINTCFAKEMENHMITETKEPSKFRGRAPTTWTLAPAPGRSHHAAHNNSLSGVTTSPAAMASGLAAQWDVCCEPPVVPSGATVR